jgi:hypothetical protein
VVTVRDPAPAARRSTQLIEIVTPRTNLATPQAVENLFAAIAASEPISLEIAATGAARWFLARAQGPEARRLLASQLAVAYPQATVRPLDLQHYPMLDPAKLGADEQVAACSLHLRGPVYLPLATASDRLVDSGASQTDPVLGILGALAGLPEGWRALTQLVLRPAPADWSQPYLRLALEHPLEPERQARTSGDRAPSADPTVLLLAGLLVLGMVGLQAYTWYDAGEWLNLALLASGGLGLAGTVGWLVTRAGRKTLYDPRLVAEKIRRPAFSAEQRLAVFAPWEESLASVHARLDYLVAAYGQYSLASGNGFRPRRLNLASRDLADLRPFHRPSVLPILTTSELAGLWHLPRAEADVPFVERTTARERLPLPTSVSSGCRIGTSAHQGREVTVSVPDEVIQRHLLLVAKTRRGKSTLLLRLARYLMEQPPAGDRIPAVVLIDPHRDLAQAALGVIPSQRRGDVVFLDVAHDERPFGLNLLDVGLGWDRDTAVANALTIFEREFSGYWGPRMEDAFRYGLNTLFEANVALSAAGEAHRQYSVLHLPTLLTDPGFQRALFPLVTDPFTRSWWDSYFRPLDRRFQLEVINPVQTKVQRFAGTRIARNIVGQARSTIAPRDWIHQGKIVVVNLAKGKVGENTAALLGGTLLNLVALAIAEQAGLDPRDRRQICLLVDEFQSVPGADYEAILAELAKFGANLILATQTLARLDSLDREHKRALRATVFANLDGLFAFHCSAEDARYLVPELGDDVDEQDLVALGEHRCYARLSARGERLPVFSVHLDPPPRSNPSLAMEIARDSSTHYGRDRAGVEDEVRTSIERVRPGEGGSNLPNERGGQSISSGEPLGAANDALPPSKRSARNQHRDRARRPGDDRQTSFLPTSPIDREMSVPAQADREPAGGDEK